MEKRYIEIRNAYNDLYRDMLRQGKFTWRPTEKGYWGMAVSDEIFELFLKLKLNKKHKLIDLGSGDGKVPLIGSVFGAHCIGIEYDKELHVIAQAMRKRLDVENVTFFNDDFHNHDLSPYDLVFINPDKSLTALEPKLQEQLNGLLVVYDPRHHPITLEKKQTMDIQGSLVSVFMKPQQ